VGALSVAAAAGVIASRVPVHSALFLLVNFATLAVLYITLDAQFLAAVQVIVYAGGIVILILFVIMLIGSDRLGEETERQPWAPLIGILFGMVLLVSMAFALFPSYAGEDAGAASLAGGGPALVGMALFTRYILPFQMAGVLLLVGLIGALLLARHPKQQS
ncbi:MAG: NADH-quinone oxidoreductase subunit J, partial [Caldilineaceae bacterium]|nr:NADH-quinone oxidoreductase subunit J [Caldilineaceae bacterium]